MIYIGENPKGQKFDLDFYLRTEVEGKFKKTTLAMKTSGGQCQHQAKKFLGEYFKSIGLPSEFDWGTDYWREKFEQDKQKWSEEELEEMKLQNKKEQKINRFQSANKNNKTTSTNSSNGYS